MKRPSLCVLLDLGVWLCAFGAVVGLLCIVGPDSNTTIRLIGFALLVSCIVFIGLQMGISWIIDTMCGEQPPEPRPNGI